MTSRIADAQNFFDINGLNSIRQQSNSSDKASKEAALQSAAKQFEAIFMQMLLKSMRSAQDVLESDSPFNSQSTKFYRDMHDQQLAVELSSNGSLGLSDLIVRQLGGDSENYMPSSALRADASMEAIAAAKQAAYQASTKQADLSQNSRIPGEPVSNNRQLDIPYASRPEQEKDELPRFEQPKDFVTALTGPAKTVERQLGVPFEVIIAQAALETGWGQKIIQKSDGQSSNNLFNIKADARWKGDKAIKETLEFEQGSMVKKKAPFRVYNSLVESVNDYIEFLSSGDRYKEALKGSGNVEHFLQGIQKAGYATDPNYANKIMGILASSSFKAMLGGFSE